MKISDTPTDKIIVKVYPDVYFKKNYNYNIGVDFAIITLKDGFFDWVINSLKNFVSPVVDKERMFREISFIENANISKSVTNFYILNKEQKPDLSFLEDNNKGWTFIELSEEEESSFLDAGKRIFHNKVVFDKDEYFSNNIYRFYIKGRKDFSEPEFYTKPITIENLLYHEFLHGLRFNIKNSYVIKNSYLGIRK